MRACNNDQCIGDKGGVVTGFFQTGIKLSRNIRIGF
jgi:hypothetical protein